MHESTCCSRAPPTDKFKQRGRKRFNKFNVQCNNNYYRQRGKVEKKMGEEGQSKPNPNSNPPPLRFDPTRMIGIIKRKALIKDLAAVYHAECLTCCQQLLELQKKWEEPYIDSKTSEDMRKEIARQPKRPKKTR